MDGGTLNNKPRKTKPKMKTLFVMFFMAAFMLLMVNVCGFITLRGDVDMAMFLRGTIASILTMMISTFNYSRI